ncbi:MAG: hypothetical protein PHS41_13590, partial [Victivallaceae bacterium]|nr:hypothetical protein [Victivallaceae bacterium]
MISSGKTKHILLAKNFLSLPEIRGILDYARTRKWNLRVPRMLELAQEIAQWRGDGILSDNECALEILKSRHVAIVGLTDLPVGLMRHADVIVASDDQRIGTMAADYFLRRGYRNYVCAAVNVRGRAYRTRVERAGFSVETLPLRFD